MLGFGLNGGQKPLSPITDLFTGFDSRGTFIGGPTRVADNLGVLQTSPANVLAVTGARLSGGVWLPTALDGSPLWPSIAVRTRKGIVAKFDSTYLGPLNEPARTNKVTCRKHNPVDTANIVKGGDAAATLAAVDFAASLTAAGLSSVCTNGKVYKLDNSAGSTTAYADLGGATGNLNPISMTVYLVTSAGTVKVGDSYGGVAWVDYAAYPTLTKVVANNKTPLNAASLMRVVAAAGAVVYFILPQLEEGAFVTSVIPGDTLATVTRPASNYTRLTAGVLRANDWGIWGRVVPSAGGQAGITDLFSSYTDVNNQTRVYATPTTIIFYKRVAGVNYTVTVNYTCAAGVPFEYQAFQSFSYGMGMRIKQDGGAWAVAVAKNDVDGVRPALIASTYQIGGRSNADQFAGNFPFTAIIMHADPRAELERMAVRYP